MFNTKQTATTSRLNQTFGQFWYNPFQQQAYTLLLFSPKNKPNRDYGLLFMNSQLFLQENEPDIRL